MDVLNFLLILAVLFTLPYLVLSAKLLFFKGKLNGFCRKQGYGITWNYTPLSAWIYCRRGIHCMIRGREKIYHVTFLSAPHRLREYSFISPDEFLILRKIVVKIVGKTRRFAQLLDLPVVGSCKSRSIDLNEAVPEGEEKVLLFYPVAKDVIWIAPGKGKNDLENGDLLYNNYRFFTRSAFLDELSSPGKYLRSPKPWEMY